MQTDRDGPDEASQHIGLLTHLRVFRPPIYYTYMYVAINMSHIYVTYVCHILTNLRVHVFRLYMYVQVSHHMYVTYVCILLTHMRVYFFHLYMYVHVRHHVHVTRMSVCGSVLQCVAVCCSVLLCVAVCCGVLLCVAVCCNVLHVLTHLRVFRRPTYVRTRTSPYGCHTCSNILTHLRVSRLPIYVRTCVCVHVCAYMCVCVRVCE